MPVLPILLVLNVVATYATPFHECGLDGDIHYIECDVHAPVDTVSMTEAGCDCEDPALPGNLPKTRKSETTTPATGTEAAVGREVISRSAHASGTVPMAVHPPDPFLLCLLRF